MGIALVVVLFCGLLLANIWYFLIRPTGDWSERVKALLGVLAVYTFGFGVVSSTGMLPQDLVDRLTSPDLFSFLSGNFGALGGISLMLSLAFEHTKGFSGFPQLVLLLMLVAVLIPVLLAFWLVYLAVIMPLSYVAYVITSVLLSGITQSTSNMALAVGDDAVVLSKVVAAHTAAFKNFSIGFVSIMVRTALDLRAFHRAQSSARSPGVDDPLERTKSPWFAVLLLCGAIAIAVVLFFAAIAAVSLPWLPRTEGPDGNGIGEVVGMEIVTCLLIWSLAVTLRKLVRRRRAITTAIPQQRSWLRAAKWASAGLIPVAVVWMSYGVVVGARGERVLRDCEAGNAASCAPACEAGVLAGCVQLGWLYQNGRPDLPRDPARSVALYRRACDAGVPLGCNNLGAMYAAGSGGLARDAARAGTLYDRACAAGLPLACNNLGAMYANAEGGFVRDIPRAMTLYQRACDGGAPLGCANLGGVFQSGTGGLPQDIRRAMELYQRGCDANNALSCSRLATIYEHGADSIDTDPVRAAALHKAACEGGVGASCFSLALAYARGNEGVAKDEATEAKLYQAACDNGHGLGCHNLAAMYAKGEGGLPVDEKRAAALYEKGCESAPRPCSALGAMYVRGSNGLVKDEARGAELFQRACSGGDAIGCSNLAIMYGRGMGQLAKERVIEAYRQGCKAGAADACTSLKRLSRGE